MLSSDDLKMRLSELRDLSLSACLVKPVTRKELFEAICRLQEEANQDGENAMPERQALEAAEHPTADARQTRILIAEDSPDNRLVIGAYLRREPYQVDFAENGTEAVQKFKAQQYDIVLMDIQMPALDGLGATRLIRQWEAEQRLAETPIIALTASVLEEDVRNALAAGCNMHLSKPIKKRTLIETIRNMVVLRVNGAATSTKGAEVVHQGT
jgi:CheY-like chemotaxis protein